MKMNPVIFNQLLDFFRTKAKTTRGDWIILASKRIKQRYFTPVWYSAQVTFAIQSSFILNYSRSSVLDSAR